MTLRGRRFVFSGIVAAGGIAALSVGGYIVGPVFILLGAFLAGMAELEHRESIRKAADDIENARRVEEVITADFAKLDVIQPDVRWVGAESTLVCHRDPYRCEEGFQQHLLCKTKKNRWFVVEYEMDRLKISSRRVYPADEGTAKSWLAYDRQTYVDHFGMPETA